MCPASHGRKVKVSECAGAPRVPQHWKAEHSYLDILVQGWRLEDLHRSGYVYVHWSEEQYDMSICACYPPALLISGLLSRRFAYTPLEDKAKVEAGKMPLSTNGTIRSAETGCPEVETSKLRLARFSVLSKC